MLAVPILLRVHQGSVLGFWLSIRKRQVLHKHAPRTAGTRGDYKLQRVLESTLLVSLRASSTGFSQMPDNPDGLKSLVRPGSRCKLVTTVVYTQELVGGRVPFSNCKVARASAVCNACKHCVIGLKLRHHQPRRHVVALDCQKSLCFLQASGPMKVSKPLGAANRETAKHANIFV